MSSEAKQKIEPSQIVRLDKALILAEQWVNSMSNAHDDESMEAEQKGRPLRLGLGAKVARQSKFQPSNDPVERKLHAKLEAGKRKAAKSNEESTPSAREARDDDSENDGELESRTSAFAKKRVGPPSSVLQAKKQK